MYIVGIFGKSFIGNSLTFTSRNSPKKKLFPWFCFCIELNFFRSSLSSTTLQNFPWKMKIRLLKEWKVHAVGMILMCGGKDVGVFKTAKGNFLLRERDMRFGFFNIYIFINVSLLMFAFNSLNFVYILIICLIFVVFPLLMSVSFS